MPIYYLMIKIHNITGLRYLCQTRKKDPHKYLGSGLEWNRHIKIYGKSIKTEIILTTTSKEELKTVGRYYSNLWQITSSMDDFGNRIWANAIPETGGGPGASKETNQKMIKDGNHPFQDRVMASERAKKLVENGTHNFLGGDIQRVSNKKRLQNKTHHFLSGKNSSIHQKSKVKEGTHHFLGGEIQRQHNRKLVMTGTHHLLGEDSPTQKKWECQWCGKEGKGSSNYVRWHGENCKLFSPLTDQSSV